MAAAKPTLLTPGPHPQDLFGDVGAPQGFELRADILSERDAIHLVERLSELPLEPFRFRGFEALRRVVSFGARYDFEAGRLGPAPAPPDFLNAVASHLAESLGGAPESVAQVLVTYYPKGAGIGWHRDRPQFETVYGLSLEGSCRLRLRPYGGGRATAEALLPPRSGYVFSGPARWAFEHAIPALDQPRWSITARTFRAGVPPPEAREAPDPSPRAS